MDFAVVDLECNCNSSKSYFILYRIFITECIGCSI